MTVRRSCHPSPGPTGSPVARSQTTVEARWLAMPTASTVPASAAAWQALRDVRQSRAYFAVPQIQQALADHQAGKRDLSKLAWRWLNLELWLRQLIDGQ